METVCEDVFYKKLRDPQEPTRQFWCDKPPLQKDDTGRVLCWTRPYQQKTPPTPVVIDGILDRPRTPNTQYTELTKEQVANIRHRPEEIFDYRTDALRVTCDNEPCYKERHSHLTTGHHHRGLEVPPYPHLCWVGDQIRRRDIEKAYDSSKGMAEVKWGPQKSGERALSNFFGTNTERFTTIDMYRRPATCYSARVVMDYGRPADGYYTQRFPDRTTWRGSVVPVNNKPVLQSVYKKTWAEHDEVKVAEQLARAYRSADWVEWQDTASNELSDWMKRSGGPDRKAWPEYSQYTRDYLLRVPYEHQSGLISSKRHALIGQRLQQLDLAESLPQLLCEGQVATVAEHITASRKSPECFITQSRRTRWDPIDSLPTTLANAARQAAKVDHRCAPENDDIDHLADICKEVKQPAAHTLPVLYVSNKASCPTSCQLVNTLASCQAADKAGCLAPSHAAIKPGCLAPSQAANNAAAGCLAPSQTANKATAGCLVQTQAANKAAAGCLALSQAANKAAAKCLAPSQAANKAAAGCLASSQAANKAPDGCLAQNQAANEAPARCLTRSQEAAECLTQCQPATGCLAHGQVAAGCLASFHKADGTRLEPCYQGQKCSKELVPCSDTYIKKPCRAS